MVNFATIILAIFLSLILSCGYTDEGKSGISKSIAESKSKKVFHIEKTTKKTINHDSIGNRITIEEFWFENMWTKGKSSDEIRKDETLYQFSANLNLNLPENLQDSIFILYNNNSSMELGLIKSRIYAYASLKIDEIPDSVYLDFYIKEDGTTKKIKTVLLK